MAVELTRPPRTAAGGFSLIEAIIASLILLVVTLGVLPLFSQAMVSNQAGAESTSVSNLATAAAEELYQLPFDHELLTLPVGDTELVTEEVWSQKEGRWMLAADLESGDRVLWNRRTRIRQFNVNELLKNAPAPLEGGTPAGSVHIKEIEVEVGSPRTGGPLRPARSLTVRLFKAQ